MCANALDGKKPGRVAAGMETQRKLKRKGFRPEFKDLVEEGIAPDGSKIRTRPMKKLGIYEPLGKKNGLLRIHFRVGGHGPKRINTMDVFRAVRQANHIQEGYLEEIRKNDAMLWRIGKENLIIAAESMDEKTIRGTIENLQEVFDSLKGLRVPEKKFSKKQLGDSIALLREALEEKRINMQKVNWACTKLFSFRIRYGNWRDREIVAISEYSKLRGYALRRMRDEWLLENISNWVRYLGEEKGGFRMKALWKRDLAFSDKLEYFANGKKIDSVNFDKVVEGLFTGGYNIRRLHRAQTALIIKDDRRARREIKEYVVLLRVRNPLYAAREMEKETDEYYQKAADYLKTALKLIERNVFHRAVYCFEKAAEEIKKGPKPQKSLDFPSQFRQ